MKLLAIGAHPDDIEIYMFGLLAAAQARGDELAFAIATDGAAGGGMDPAELRRVRRKEATDAAAVLNVTPHFLDFPDGALVADAALIGALRDLVKALTPDLIVTHAPNDYHGDHRAVSDAVRIAANFTAPVLWADTMLGTGFVPTHYVEITPYFELKARAARAHVSQKPERLVEMAAQLGALRAAQTNATPGSYAEAYRFEPTFPFADIRELLPPAPPLRPVGSGRSPRA